MAYASFPTTVPANDPNGRRLTLPAMPINYGIKTNNLFFTSDSGYEQRRLKGQPKRSFDLNYPILLLDEYKTIRDFYLQVLNITPFYWTDPVEKTRYLVRFDQETFSAQQKHHGPKGPTYELQLKLLEVFA